MQKINFEQISLNEKKLGLLTLSFFTKEIEGLIYSGGNRYIVRGTADSLYGLPDYADTYQIINYKTNNLLVENIINSS